MHEHDNLQIDARIITLPGASQHNPSPGMRDLSWAPANAFESNDARMRALRESDFAASLLGSDRFARFWFRDLRRLSLFLTLMRESAWLRGGEWGCFPMAVLAQRSKMSVARVYQVLNLARATGDFLYRRDPRDARLILLEPSPAAQHAFATLTARFSEALSAFFGRPDPLIGLSPDEQREARAAMVEAALDILARAQLEDRGTGSTTFLLAMLDLWLHSPMVAADFVRREALRLQVTQVTMRNVLHRAEAIGLITRMGRMVHLTEASHARIAAAAGSVMVRLAMLHLQTEARLRSAASTVCVSEAPAVPVQVPPARRSGRRRRARSAEMACAAQ